ncbi:Noc2p family-domain-containing protein [Cyathus striatus]|nr:Noc2p family-domain-containing protein [Cyathus striatus]
MDVRENMKRHYEKKSVGRQRGGGGQAENSAPGDENGSDDEDEQPSTSKKRCVGSRLTCANAKGMSVDEFLSCKDSDEEDADDEEEDFDDNASFASIDELDEEGKNHLQELSKLAEKDPEFYKYLQENDRELLNFGLETFEEEEMDVDDEEKLPVLTIKHILQWQRALLKVLDPFSPQLLEGSSKTACGVQSCAHMNEDDQVLAWSIDSSAGMWYTPVVLQHHIPYKTLANGKFKAPTQSAKFTALQKLILSFFHNIIHIFSQLTDDEVIQLAVTESAKLIPYVVSSRKAVKSYLKKCLDIWSSARDAVRMSAFLSIRKLASAPDDSIHDTILKSTYLTLVRSCKSTTAHTLPSINLMKNSASEVFCLDHAAAYQHAFGYIRQLAIHLRNSMKVKTKEAYKQVYNWQYIHCIDFWCIVLARACDVNAEAAAGKESELRPLIYPLVQISLGSIKLIPHSRSYPFHLHVIRSLLHLTKHTETYIPIAPYILPIINSVLSPSARPRSSTLKPLDFDVQIRIPQQYLKTRVYYEGVTEEAAFHLAEWLCSSAVHGSIAFPEIVVPLVVILRKDVKNAASGTTKEQGIVKNLLERVEDSARWIEQKRKGVVFAPGKVGEVQEWERDIRASLDDAPLRKFLKVQRKAREKRRKLMEKAREGEDEILED